MASSIRKSSFGKWTLARWGTALVISQAIGTLTADLTSGTAPKSKKGPARSGVVTPTALAEPVAAEVDRAGEVTLRIRGIASGGGQVEFRLMQKPRAGKIVRSQPAGLDTLEIVYRHSGERRAASDTFIFGVRAGNAGPFSPGQATIRIKDVPGRLLAPEALDFSPVLVGETATDSFLLTNDGGAPLQGTITVTAPWEVAPPTAYDLRPGQKQKITVLFRPVAGGSFRGRIQFGGTDPAAVELTGQGTTPFLASPASLNLVPDASGKRSAVVSLQNTSSQPIDIQVASELPIETSLTLKFGEIREFLVSDNGGPALQGQIVFSSGTFTTRIEVQAGENTPFHEPEIEATPTPSPTPLPVIAQEPPPATPPTEPTPLPAATPLETPIPVAKRSSPWWILAAVVGILLIPALQKGWKHFRNPDNNA